MLFKKKKTFHYFATKNEFEKQRDIQAEDYLQCPDWAKPVRDSYGNYEEEPDALYPLFDPFLQQRFYKEGTVALGALVQANTLLFERGKDNCPANYIYTTDPFFAEHPEELEKLANQLYDLKGEEGCRPSLQVLADLLEDEEERIFAYKLPRDFTNHREVFFTTVFVDRSHLPEKKISGSFLPLLILKNHQPDAVILPHWYWKEEGTTVSLQTALEKSEAYSLEIEDHLYELYGDFQRRNSMDEWNFFLQRPELSDANTFDEVSKQLLSYLLDCGNIKQEIVQHLEDHFHYTKRIDYYAEAFSYNAMEYYGQALLTREECPPIGEFGDLLPDADYDGFIEKFRELYYDNDYDTPETYLTELNKLKQFEIYHPYMALLESEYFARCLDAENAMAVLRAMKPCYHRHLALGLLCVELEYYAEGEESLRYAWELHKGRVDSAFVEGMFIALFCQGKHGEALAFSDKMEAVGFGAVLADYKKEVLASFYEYAGEKVQQEPLEDEEISLIFAYLKLEKEYDKIIALGEKQRDAGRLSQRDWLTFIEACILSDRAEAAAENIKAAFENVSAFDERALVQMKVLRAQVHFLQRETAKAYEIMDELYQRDVFDIKQLEVYGQMCRMTGRYQTAEKIYSRLRFEMPQNPEYTIELAKIFLNQDENRRAYRLCKNGMERFWEEEELAFICVQALIDDGDDMRAKMALRKAKDLLSEGKYKFLKGQLAEMDEAYGKAKNIYGGLLTGTFADAIEPKLREDIYYRYFLMMIEEEIDVHDFFPKLDRAIAKLSSNSKLYQLYGEVQEATMEDTIAAKKYYKLALEANPYNNEALLKLMSLCTETHCNDEAWEYASCHVINTDSADAYMLRAHIGLDAGRFDSFSTDVERYIQRGGNKGEAWDIAASHAMKTENYEKALECYEKVLEYGISDEIPCYEEIATCYCKMGRYKDAVNLLQQAVLQEDYADFYPLLMEIQMYIGDFGGAKRTLEDFRKASGLSKTDDTYIFYRAMQLLGEGKFKTLVFTCASNEDNEVNYLNAQAWLLNGNYKMAIGAFSILHEADENNLDIMCWLALAFALYGDFDQAKSVAARARGRFKSIHGEPETVNRSDLLCQYGLLQTLCGKPERAAFAFEKAMTVPTCQEEICQQCHEAHYGMGLLHGLCGEKEAAKEAFDKAIAMSPYNSVYKALKGQLTK